MISGNVQEMALRLQRFLLQSKHACREHFPPIRQYELLLGILRLSSEVCEAYFRNRTLIGGFGGVYGPVVLIFIQFFWGKNG